MKEQSACVVVLLAGLFCSGLMAEAEAATDDITARIEALEQEIKALKVQQQAQAVEAQKQQSMNAHVRLDQKGLKINSPDDRYEMSLRGYMQIDHRAFLNDDAGTGDNEFLARRLRPVWEAKAGDASFRFMPEFAGDAARIYDAYVEYALTDDMAVRAGKFKVPLGLERLQSASDLMFVERGLPTNLVTNRDFGAMLLGGAHEGALEYQLGIFNGNADLSDKNGDVDDRKEVAGRVFGYPLAQVASPAWQRLGVGVAGSYGHQHGQASEPLLPEYKSAGQQVFFSYLSDTYANGTHWRLVPQAHWYYKNLGMQAEYALSHQDVLRQTAAAELLHTSWQVAGVYVLTGEDVRYNGAVVPQQDFSLHGEGMGAWGVAARLGQLDVDDEAFAFAARADRAATKASSAGVGVNWWLNENLELVTDYNYTSFNGGVSAGGDRPDEHALFSRAQFRF